MDKSSEATELTSDDFVNPPSKTGVLPPPSPPVRRLHPCVWLTVVSGIMFFIAPWLNALQTIDAGGNPGTYPGWPLLFFGWIETLSVVDGKFSGIGWLANPLYLFGTLAILSGSRRTACLVTCVAASFSAGGFLLVEVPVNEAGTTAMVVGQDVGFCLWMAAMWVNFLAAMLINLVPDWSLHRQSAPTRVE